MGDGGYEQTVGMLWLSIYLDQRPILMVKQAECSSFTLEESCEDDPKNLYFRPPQKHLTDYDAGLFFSGQSGPALPRRNSPKRRNARAIVTFVP